MCCCFLWVNKWKWEKMLKVTPTYTFSLSWHALVFIFVLRQFFLLYSHISFPLMSSRHCHNRSEIFVMQRVKVRQNIRLVLIPSGPVWCWVETIRGLTGSRCIQWQTHSGTLTSSGQWRPLHWPELQWSSIIMLNKWKNMHQKFNWIWAVCKFKLQVDFVNIFPNI